MNVDFFYDLVRLISILSYHYFIEIVLVIFYYTKIRYDKTEQGKAIRKSFPFWIIIAFNILTYYIDPSSYSNLAYREWLTNLLFPSLVEQGLITFPILFETLIYSMLAFSWAIYVYIARKQGVGYAIARFVIWIFVFYYFFLRYSLNLI